MTPLDFSKILQNVTVDSKDDGEKFQVYDRIEAIRSLLQPTDYQLLKEGKLFLLYGKKPVAGRTVVVISSHIDCVYGRCYCADAGDCYQGTFDNALTNAAVICEMLSGRLGENVVVAFTGDEEKDSAGCHELIEYLFSQTGCEVKFALVTDVTNEGWEAGAPFSLENDAGLDLFTAHDVVEWLSPYVYSYVHEAEPDESWDYQAVHIPSFTLCVPVKGDMHHDNGVLARKAALPVYREVLTALANALGE